MKNIAIIQARMNSTRFPGKILKTLHGKNLIEWIVGAARKIDLITNVVIATSDNSQEAPLVDFCKKANIDIFQGSENDVLSRYYEAAKKYGADNVIRLTADCPLLDPTLCSQILYSLVHLNYDYVSNTSPPTWPDGLDCEAFTFKTLKAAHEKATKASDREHVTAYINSHRQQFKIGNMTCPIPNLTKHRWTVDHPEDLAYLEQLLNKTDGQSSMTNLLNAIQTNSNLKQPEIKRNESFEKQVASETTDNTEFKTSQSMLQRAIQVIPLGSQTFSKSHIQYPEKTSPHFVTHGYGSHVWDVDGNEYIDLVNALLPNVLGYADPDVNFAVQAQLQNGVSMSLATELEVKVAEKLCSLVPSAEKVRFGKNGTDATSAAIRLARAFTARDKVLVCGYHGWQDWFIGTTTRNLGVPQAVCDLSTAVPYNDLEKIQTLLKTEKFAAIIMEPCNAVAPLPGYLQGVKEACEKYGSVLIFDEIITGFRFSLGGAQDYFKVTPHLSCLGKGMANGFPLSAVVGSNPIMKKMEDIFFSGTFGGETLSLTASLTTIEKMEKNNVIQYLWDMGEKLNLGTQKLIQKHGLSEVVATNGFAPWKILSFKDSSSFVVSEIRTFFIQEMIRHGVLITGSHNICSAFTDNDLSKVLAAYDATFGYLSESLTSKTLMKNLKSPAIQPLFKVR